MYRYLLKLNRYYYIIILLTLFVIVAIKIADTHLQSEVSIGIVSFELVKNFKASQHLLSLWSNQAKDYALYSLVIDFLFIILYVLFFVLTINRVVAYFSSSNIFVKTGKTLIPIVFLAGLFDLFENFFLLKILSGSQKIMYPEYAFWFASFKFTIVAVVVLYLLLALIKFIFKKISK